MIQTKRTFIRNLFPEDSDVLFYYRNDSRCYRYQRYEDTSKTYLDKFVKTYAHCMFLSTEKEQHYAVVCKANGKMIGDVSVFYNGTDNCFTLGITISPLYQKQGYAYEVLNEVVLQMQNRYPAVDVVALIEKENEGSIALFKKLGFIEECYADSIQSYIFVKQGRTN